MKKITLKLIFDLIMAVTWISLMIYSLTGAFWHEVIGLMIFALFTVHIGYNIPRMIKEIPRAFQKRKSSLRLRYILDASLLLFGLFTGISGILISQEILLGITVSNIPLWVMLHKWAAYLTMAGIGIHIGLHMKMIAAVVARPFKEYPVILKGIKAATNLAAIGLILYGFVANTSYVLPSISVAAASDSDQKADSSKVVSQEVTGTDDTVTITYTSDADDDTPTLSEYLGSLTCTACHRHCPLTALQCGRGTQQAQAAEEEYYQLYQADAVSDSQDNVSDSGNTDNLTASTDEDAPTLSEYLGSLTCTACHRNCPLTALQCSRGTQQAQAAEEEYYQLYGSNAGSYEEEDTDSEEAVQNTLTESTKGQIGEMTSIMGMYIGGTYYISQFKRRRRQSK